MCGNFGLLMMGTPIAVVIPDVNDSPSFKKPASEKADVLDASLHESLHEVSRLRGIRVVTDMFKEDGTHFDKSSKEVKVAGTIGLLSPLAILQSQTASTEIRGGQAGGYSSFEYDDVNKGGFSVINKRVRLVARKRHALAADLAVLYKQKGGRVPSDGATLSVIGHTRFATSSVNQVSELHPHEWVPLHPERVWQFNSTSGSFAASVQSVGLHITHNGDFDALEAYSQTMVVDEVGLWLERVLHVPNSCKGDSPKVAGCMDLFRVQGRWGPAARLAWVRCVLKTSTDVCGGAQLSKGAPNTFPTQEYFELWAAFIDSVFVQHVNNIIRAEKNFASGINNPLMASKNSDKTRNAALYQYRIEAAGEAQFLRTLLGILGGETGDRALRQGLNIADWSEPLLLSFLHTALRGFFRADLYTAMTEFLSRAEGSFGLQTHCSLEPGVVVIASKGQPMSLAFNPALPICLYGSEAEALAVPVDQSGRWLPERIDLDSHGEVVRIGVQKALLEGHYCGPTGMPTPRTSMSMTSSSFKDAIPSPDSSTHKYTTAPSPGSSSHKVTFPHMALSMIEEEVNVTPAVPPSKRRLSDHIRSSIPRSSNEIDSSDGKDSGSPRFGSVRRTATPLSNSRLLLDCGMEIRSYSLDSASEYSTAELLARCVTIISAPIPYDPSVDLVAADLKVTPAVIAAIDRAWASPTSLERVSADSLSDCLVECMQRRSLSHEDTTDLLIGGIEASLWIAEQWAADLRTIFPHINIETVSANKLLGLGSHSASKAFFPGTDAVLSRRIDEKTCVLMISQSGQTFPTLHATRKLSHLVGDRLWLLTGCFGSKMEQAMKEGYREMKIPYGRNRVFNNYSGNRPAEPSSVAVAATWHTLTRLLLQLVYTVREACPGGRLLQPWEKTDVADVGGGNALMSDKIVEVKTSSSHGESVIPIGEMISSTVATPIPSTSSHDVDISTRPTRYMEKNIETSEERKEAPAAPSHQPSPMVMMLSDGCIEDMSSLLFTSVVTNLSVIVGFDIDGEPLNAPKPLTAVQRVARILDPHGLTGIGTRPRDMSAHGQLVHRGRAWAAHITEPWRILVCAGAYIILSVGLEITICALLGDAVLAIVRAGGAYRGDQLLNMLPRYPALLRSQPIGFTLIGLVLQFADALVFVFLGKMMTWADRWLAGRPMWARMGKRTLVIVDIPCVHQLLETFVSKLYAQGYSFCSIEVHGASGLDHFVHRFTHRVVRGLLIAVGRPDGRLCCLAKSEAAVLLSAKQAAFIRNPDYPGESAGPEIVTLGHNPYQPNVGLGHHIVLTDTLTRGKGKERVTGSRRKFVDEYLYERLFLASKPFTAAILKALAVSRRDFVESVSEKRLTVPISLKAGRPPSNRIGQNMTSLYLEGIDSIIQRPASNTPQKGLGYSQHDFDLSRRGSLHSHGSMHGYTKHSSQQKGRKSVTVAALRDSSTHASVEGTEPLPYGTHHIDPARALEGGAQKGWLFAEFVLNSKGLLTKKLLQGAGDIDCKKENSNDPAVRLAFASRLDSETRSIQDRQVVVQQFYECRIAALERYLGFCVMFHAMAESSRAPWLQVPWNIARSQSNLRVSTTASPISAGGDHEAGSTPELKKCARQLGAYLRGYQINF